MKIYAFDYPTYEKNKVFIEANRKNYRIPIDDEFPELNLQKEVGEIDVKVFIEFVEDLSFQLFGIQNAMKIPEVKQISAYWKHDGINILYNYSTGFCPEMESQVGKFMEKFIDIKKLRKLSGN